MINMIEKLYLGFINKVSRRKIKESDINKYGQNDAYDKLKATLLKEQYALLDDYLDKLGMEESDIMINNYIQSFKQVCILELKQVIINYDK